MAAGFGFNRRFGFNKPPMDVWTPVLTQTGSGFSTNSNGTLTKTASTAWGNAAVRSTQTFTTSAQVEVLLISGAMDSAIGFTETPSLSYDTLHGACQPGNPTASVVLGGGPYTTFGATPGAGSTVIVRQDATHFKVWINTSTAGAPDYSVAWAAPAGPMYFQCAFYTQGDAIKPIYLGAPR